MYTEQNRWSLNPGWRVKATAEGAGEHCAAQAKDTRAPSTRCVLQES